MKRPDTVMPLGERMATLDVRPPNYEQYCTLCNEDAPGGWCKCNPRPEGWDAWVKWEREVLNGTTP